MKLLFDHFDKLAEAPSGVKKLRELILQLAVQGKLVPQDPNDEPATVLIEKIKAEKEQLIKEGKIKKQKPLEPIKDSEIPFEVPKWWKWCRLGNIIYITSGKGLTSKDMQNGNIPVYGGNGITGYHNTYNLEERTLVIGRVGFYCGSIHITPDRAWVTDNAFKTIFSGENIEIHFLELLLKTFDLKEKESATAQPVISGRKIYPILLPLPPLAEQKRIVAKLDSLMALCDDLEKQHQEITEKKLLLNKSSLNALSASANQQDFNKNWNHIANNFDLLYSTPKNIDDLKQAILQLAVMGKLVPQDPNDEPASVLLEKIQDKKERLVEEGMIRRQKPLEPIKESDIPFNVPEGWEWCRLGEVCDINMGQSPPGNTYNNFGEGIPLINGPVEFTTGPFGRTIRHQYTSKPTKVCKKGDFLLCVRGSTTGRTNIADFNACIGRGVAALHAYIDCDYFNWYIVSIREMLYASGTGSTFKNISSEIISKTFIPLPVLAEQKRIVAKVDSLIALCDQLKENLINKSNTSENLLNAVVSQL